MDHDLSDACQMFLIPATILFAALGASSTDQLKTLISLMGIATSGLWFYQLRNWHGIGPEVTPGIGVAMTLAAVFSVAWVLSAVVHAWLWARSILRWLRSRSNRTLPDSDWV